MMKTVVKTVLTGLLSVCVLVTGRVAVANEQKPAADATSTVKLELVAGGGKSHGATVTLGQTARDVLIQCKPAKAFAEDDPWIGYAAAQGGSYVLLFAAEGSVEQMKGRLDPSRDKLYAVVHYPTDSQENGKFLLPETLRERTCGEIVTLRLLVAADKARVVTVALGLSADDVRQLTQPASARAPEDDVLSLDALEAGDRYQLVFTPREEGHAHDAKTNKLTEVIYYQRGRSQATYLFPREKRGAAVPGK